jgi:DNA-binding response OmpR family regulator
MAAALDPKGRINFTDVSVLLLEQNDTAVDMLAQIFSGFGARQCHKATSVEAAVNAVSRRDVDLVILEPDLGVEDGLDFVRWLRRSASQPSRSAPALAVSATATEATVRTALAAGVNFFAAKPVSGTLLMSRLVWILKDGRPFVECDAFAGPDRRFKMMGPPPGSAGRRAADLPERLSEAAGQNLTQDDIDQMIKPQKVQL